MVSVIEQRMDPTLAPGLEVYRMLGFDSDDLSGETLIQMRVTLGELMTAMAAELPPNEAVKTTEHVARNSDGGEMAMRVHRPVNAAGPLPLLYWIHGGGMIIGFPAMDDVACQAYAEQVGCVVVAPDYRLAPQHPHPAPVEDCYAGLLWAVEQAELLGIDTTHIAVAGASSGGGLAAGTCLLARDGGTPEVAYQALVYPMLDDRNDSESARRYSGILTWSREHNSSGWRALLGDSAGGDEVSPYAAPARAKDLAGLPPTLIQVGELEVFLDEDIDYARRLLAAGVPTELHVYPQAYHGWEGFNPESPVAQQCVRDRTEAIARALHPA